MALPPQGVRGLACKREGRRTPASAEMSSSGAGWSEILQHEIAIAAEEHGIVEGSGIGDLT